MCDTRLNIIHILPSFTMLYAQVLKRPSLLSARSDAELLFVTAQIIDHYMSHTPEKMSISEITQSMAAAALNAVKGSSMSSRGRTLGTVPNPSPTATSSSNPQASGSPASYQDTMGTSSNTPLSFYFNVTPDHQAHEPSVNELESQAANAQLSHDPSFHALDGLTMPTAMDVRFDQSPTGSRLWFPPY
jgi:hypothetical protein